MGSRFALLAQSVIALSLPAVAAAEGDKTALARELFDLGVEEYKAKQYDAAAASMAKSYSLDPQPNALYAQAQAERLGGKCKEAIAHYRLVIDTAKDDKIITAVKANVELCQQIERGEESKEVPTEAKTAERDAPVLEIRTVYRTESRTDKIAVVLFAGGGLALGGSLAMYLVARSASSDAERAGSLVEYNDLYDRAAQLRWMSYAAAGIGLGCIAVAAYRLIGGSGETRVQGVAIVPTPGGSLVSWSSAW
jgi:tetratricopeptide (TPR) repeat protein